MQVYNNMFIHISKNIEKIVDGEFEGFLNSSYMRKYVDKLDQLAKMYRQGLWHN